MVAFGAPKNSFCQEPEARWDTGRHHYRLATRATWWCSFWVQKQHVAGLSLLVGVSLQCLKDDIVQNRPLLFSNQATEGRTCKIEIERSADCEGNPHQSEMQTGDLRQNANPSF